MIKEWTMLHMAWIITCLSVALHCVIMFCHIKRAMTSKQSSAKMDTYCLACNSWSNSNFWLLSKPSGAYAGSYNSPTESATLALKNVNSIKE